MNKTLFLLLPLGLIVSGCPAVDEPVEPPSPRNCVVLDLPDRCPGNDPKNPQVELPLDSMAANPLNVCAEQGSQIEFTLVPKPDDFSSVAIRAKDASNTWLNGTNDSTKGKIFIDVPIWVVANMNYDYGVETNAGDCADPRVHVETATAETPEQLAEPDAEEELAEPETE